MKMFFDVFRAILGMAVSMYGAYLFVLEEAPDLVTFVMIVGGFACFLTFLIEGERDYEESRKSRSK